MRNSLRKEFRDDSLQFGTFSCGALCPSRREEGLLGRKLRGVLFAGHRVGKLMSVALGNANAAATGAISVQIRSASPARYVFLDVWRGLAIIGVVIYHFGWDLNFFGFISPAVMFSGPVTIFARALAGSFMFLVGVSLVVANENNVRWRKFLIRLAKLVGAAAAISIITYILFPEGFIYFGILHSIALASVLGLAFLPLPTGLIFLAAVAMLAAPFFFDLPAFDTRILAWIGFAANPPVASDFVPVFPWFGVTLAGMGCARLFLSRQMIREAAREPAEGALIRALAWIGQRTLPIYLLHQPLLFGGFVVFTR
mgnify:CR=1 FL=1